MEFEKELEQLINRCSMENDSNTPDFILAQYLTGCLAVWNTACQQRETWYGRDARPSATITAPARRGKERMMQIQAFRCEKIPEKEFDRDKKWALEPGWRESFRKDGMVYIVYDLKPKADREG